jgi:acyl dehydratase
MKVETETRTELRDIAGLDLGAQVVRYDDRDTILYALAVGARADQLDLVHERQLRALPTMACAFGLWAVEAAGRLGAYDPHRSLHASQRLLVHEPLPAAGALEMRGRVGNVWDKGKASLVEVEVEAQAFTATYSIFLPGLGGWGGERGPASGASEPVDMELVESLPTSPELAALYRLTGDRHPVHIDPAVAAQNGFSRPILHGLCTLGIAARSVARVSGHHPADLRELDARLAAPVLPGETVEVHAGQQGDSTDFEARVGETTVIKGGRARFASW